MIQDHAAFTNSAPGVHRDPAPGADAPLLSCQTPFPQAGAEAHPFITLPPLLGARGNPAMASRLIADILTVRRDQALRNGHTAQADDALDLFTFARHGERTFASMREYASLARIEQTRLYAVKLAAFAMALAESCTRRLDQIEGTTHVC